MSAAPFGFGSPADPDAIRKRSTLLPFGVNEAGRVVPAMPQLLVDALNAAQFPGQVYRGEKEVFDPATGHVSHDAIVASTEMASLAGGTDFARAAASKMLPAAEEGLVSRVVPSYDPIPRPARPFEADYPPGRWPDGPPADASGRLTRDIEGRPLQPTAAIAGTRRVGEASTPLSAAELDATAKATLGDLPVGAAPHALGRGTVGQFVRSHDPDTGEATYNIFFDRRLSPEARNGVVAHEFGHVVDHFTGGIPQDGIKKELGAVYNELNNGNLQNAVRMNGGDIAQALAARVNNRNMKPSAFGYSDKEAPAELTAEAIRAYMTDPNAMKTMAPKTAAAIREAVNTNPILSPHIQFNSLAGAGLLGAGALAAGSSPADGAELPKGPSPMGFGFGSLPGAPANMKPEDLARLFGQAPLGAAQAFAGTATGAVPSADQFQAPLQPVNMPMPPQRPAGFGFGAPPGVPQQAATAAPQSSAIANPPLPPPRPLSFGALPTPEADMPAVDAVPTAGTMPAPAVPAAAESPGFSIGDIFRRIHSSGADDTLIGLGTGLMSTKGFGNGLAAGFQNAQKYGATRSATDLARTEMALKTGKLAREARSENATAQAIATKLGIPLDQAQGFASNPTFVSEFLKGQYGASDGFARGSDGTLRFVPGGPQDPNTIRQQTAAKEPSLERVEAQATAQTRGAAAGSKDDVQLVTRPDGSIVAVNKSQIGEGSTAATVTPIAAAGNKLAAESKERREAVVSQGGDPNDPRYKDYILSGSLPKENQQQLTAADKQAIREGEDSILSHRNALTQLRRGLELSPKAYEGVTAGGRATFMTNWPEALGGGGEAAMATREFDNTMSAQMLDSLKAIFGGNPTEGERAALKDIQGISSMPHELREKVIRNAIAKVESRLGFEEQRVNDLRGGTYYKPRTAETAGGAPTTPAPVAPAGGAPARPQSRSDYDALPSGAQYIAPDGSVRKKP